MDTLKGTYIQVHASVRQERVANLDSINLEYIMYTIFSPSNLPLKFTL